MSQSRLDELMSKLRNGDKLALARVITKIENRDKDTQQIIKNIYSQTGSAKIIGITGPPGAGKSTLVDQMTKEFRAKKLKVAIVAIDPSSPFSGGAILGDRIRMQDHSTDSGVYIRSLGTRGKRGGLSHSTKEVVLTLDAAGFDVVLVETAGVGQTELDILKLAHTVLVVLVPESGDSIQMMKAGLMEIADVFAINKSDRPGADKIQKELVTLVGMSQSAWKPPIQKTEAVSSVGISELMNKIESHQNYLHQSGQSHAKRLMFLREEVSDILVEDLLGKLSDYLLTDKGSKFIDDLEARKTDPYSASVSIAKQIKP